MDLDGLSDLFDFPVDQTTPEWDNDDDAIDDPDETPASVSQDPKPNPQRVIRRRARKACVACHKRKVRCDVLSRGRTCTNCRLDGLNCVIRSNKTRQDGARNPPDEKERMSSTASVKSIPADQPTADAHVPLETPERSLLTLSTNPTEDAFSHLGAHSLPMTNQFSSPSGPGAWNSQTNIMFSYFDFLQSESFSHLAPEDFQFLEYKGCFHLPPRPVLDDLVREYFLHVHPTLPIIDEREFWQAYLSVNQEHKKKKISLFVFRAMLFVSCGFASDETIRRLGFPRPIEARNCMYRRAKLLYDFNTTSDSIALCQGTLLLTYYCSGREPMANTSWLRLAIQYANSINVSNYEEDLSLSVEERQTRKRLWWCIILRDRILPLGVRRSIQITHDHFDFSKPRLSNKDLDHESSSSCVYERNTKRDLAGLLEAQLDLAVMLTDIMPLMYPTNGSLAFDKLDYNSMCSMQLKMQNSKEKLETWCTQFDKSYSAAELSRKHKSISLYSGLTRIYHQSALAALCQCESFMLQAMSESARQQRMKQLGSALHASVITISDTIRQFVQLDIAKYVPVSVVAYVALPILLSSLDLQDISATKQRTEAKRRQLRILNEAMDLCHDRYDGASEAQATIAKVIQAGRVELDYDEVAHTSSTSLTRPISMGDWFETFVSQPTRYLRISFILDVSLSIGHYAQEQELPRYLSMKPCLVPRASIPPTLLLHSKDSVQNSEECEMPQRDRDLDFLSLVSP